MTSVDPFFSIDSVGLVAFLLLYAGPDQILPLVSVIGTIIGLLLLWWKRFVALLRKVSRNLSRKPQEIEAAEPPTKG